VVDAFAARIDEIDAPLGAFHTLRVGRARSGGAEAAWRRGEPSGALCGRRATASRLLSERTSFNRGRRSTSYTTLPAGMAARHRPRLGYPSGV
jgi:hypothetical protein